MSVVSACLSALVSFGDWLLVAGVFWLLVGRWFMLVVSPAFDGVDLVWWFVIVFVVGCGVDGCRPADGGRPGGWCCLVLGVRRGLLVVVGVGYCPLWLGRFVRVDLGDVGVLWEWGRGVGGRR